MQKDNLFNKNNFLKNGNSCFEKSLSISDECSPFISIIIPTYKRLETLKQSVNCAINQKEFENFEIVIIDNDDKSDESILKYLTSLDSNKIQYYKNKKNIGMVGNWNRGILLSRGKWITILCDDDLLDQWFLKCMSDIIINNPQINYLQAEHIDFKNDQSDPVQKDYHLNKKMSSITKIKKYRMLFGNINCNIGTLMKKELCIQLGGFCEDLYPSFDHAFAKYYLHTYGNGYFLNRVLAFYRNDANTSVKIETKLGFIEKDFLIYDFFITQLHNKNKFMRYFYTILTLKSLQTINDFTSSKENLKIKLFKKTLNPSNFNVWLVKNLVSFLCRHF